MMDCDVMSRRFWIIFFTEIWRIVDHRRRLQIIALILLNISSALADALSLASLVPFLSFLMNPERSENYFPRFFLDLTPHKQFLLICVTYFALAMIAGYIRMANLWVNNKLSFLLGSDISKRLFTQTLNNNYDNLSKVASSDFVDMLVKKSDALVSGGIIPIVQLLSSSVVIIFTVSLLLYLSPSITITLFASIIIIYSFIFYLIKKIIKINSQLISDKSRELIKCIQEAILCKVEIIIYKKQNYFTDRFYLIDTHLRDLEAKNQFYMHSPKIALEMIGILLIAGAAIYFNITDINSSVYIPILATFALASQRMLPNFQQIYAAIVNIGTRSAILSEVIAGLKSNKIDLSLKTRLEFNNNSWHQLKFDNVEYKYEGSLTPTLRMVNFTIDKGDRLGIFGNSGNGKTTLAMLVMGLKNPTSGRIWIDNKSYSNLNADFDWFSQIAYVPQSVPLLNASIKENIAFGHFESDVDIDLLHKVIGEANLYSDIMKLADGYMSSVGEFGYKLSGGQKLKLGLARALYRKPKFLVLDEYTSALDKDSEAEIVNVIKKLSREITIIIVSHRPEAMIFCDKFIKVNQGSIINLNEI